MKINLISSIALLGLVAIGSGVPVFEDKYGRLKREGSSNLRGGSLTVMEEPVPVMVEPIEGKQGSSDFWQEVPVWESEWDAGNYEAEAPDIDLGIVQADVQVGAGGVHADVSVSLRDAAEEANEEPAHLEAKGASQVHAEVETKQAPSTKINTDQHMSIQARRGSSHEDMTVMETRRGGSHEEIGIMNEEKSETRRGGSSHEDFEGKKESESRRGGSSHESIQEMHEKIMDQAESRGEETMQEAMDKISDFKEARDQIEDGAGAFADAFKPIMHSGNSHDGHIMEVQEKTMEMESRAEEMQEVMETVADMKETRDQVEDSAAAFADAVEADRIEAIAESVSSDSFSPASEGIEQVFAAPAVESVSSDSFSSASEVSQGIQQVFVAPVAESVNTDSFSSASDGIQQIFISETTFEESPFLASENTQFQEAASVVDLFTNPFTEFSPSETKITKVTHVFSNPAQFNKGFRTSSNSNAGARNIRGLEAFKALEERFRQNQGLKEDETVSCTLNKRNAAHTREFTDFPQFMDAMREMGFEFMNDGAQANVERVSLDKAEELDTAADNEAEKIDITTPFRESLRSVFAPVDMIQRRKRDAEEEEVEAEDAAEIEAADEEAEAVAQVEAEADAEIEAAEGETEAVAQVEADAEIEAAEGETEAVAQVEAEADAEVEAAEGETEAVAQVEADAEIEAAEGETEAVANEEMVAEEIAETENAEEDIAADVESEVQSTAAEQEIFMDLLSATVKIVQASAKAFPRAVGENAEAVGRAKQIFAKGVKEFGAELPTILNERAQSKSRMFAALAGLQAAAEQTRAQLAQTERIASDSPVDAAELLQVLAHLMSTFTGEQ